MLKFAETKNRVGVLSSLTVLGAVCLLLGGCIRSRVIVTSDPPGARVTMNNVYEGKTPVEVPFTWYWYYNIELQKDGYEPMTVQERFRAPVYFWIPFDVVAEAMPFPLYDTKRRHYVMVVQPPEEALPGQPKAPASSSPSAATP